MPENVTTITVRELKTRASELLRRFEADPTLEFVITRHGKPCAKLVALGRAEKVPSSERITLRGTWAGLHELSDADFAEAKRIWEPEIGNLIR